jgi:hypothetical protein
LITGKEYKAQRLRCANGERRIISASQELGANGEQERREGEGAPHERIMDHGHSTQSPRGGHQPDILSTLTLDFEFWGPHGTFHAEAFERLPVQGRGDNLLEKSHLLSDPSRSFRTVNM